MPTARTSDKPLDYAGPVVRRAVGRVIFKIGVAFGVIAGLFYILAMPVRQSAFWVDPVTGSGKWQTTWIFGLTARPSYQISGLERRLTALQYQWPRQWHFMGNEHLTLLGKPTMYECGSAPEVYRLHPCIDEFAKTSTDAELKVFADTMQFGTDPQRKAAVDGAVEKALASLSASH